jgi:hypothetical protein
MSDPRPTLETGSYTFVAGNGGAMFVRIEGNHLTFFDDPVDPITATIYVNERTFSANLGDEGQIEDGHLVFKGERYELFKAGDGVTMPVITVSD